MLIIQDKPTFEGKCRIALKALQAEFTLVYHLLPPERFRELGAAWRGQLDYAKFKARQEADPTWELAVTDDVWTRPPTVTDDEFCREVVAGFGADVVGVDGQPVEFSQDTLKQLLRLPGARLAIINGFFDGYGPAEEKNSGAPLVG